MFPPPPPLFTTMICWPRPFSISAAKKRATMLELPPGANGTSRWIGFVGYACAPAFEKIKNSRREANRIRPLLELIAAQAAVDRNHGAGDIARERRGEEAGEVREILR